MFYISAKNMLKLHLPEPYRTNNPNEHDEVKRYNMIFTCPDCDMMVKAPYNRFIIYSIAIKHLSMTETSDIS